MNIQFEVGNNDLDFYKFMNENGELPDIITCCRFSLHDAAPLKDSLMDLSTTSEAGAIYDSYLTSFTNEDGSINWLPLCADVHGFITVEHHFLLLEMTQSLQNKISISAERFLQCAK